MLYDSRIGHLLYADGLLLDVGSLFSAKYSDMKQRKLHNIGIIW